MIGDRIFLRKKKIASLVVIEENFGVSTCRVILSGLIGNSLQQKGDYLLNTAPYQGMHPERCVLLGDFRIDAYTAGLPDPAHGSVGVTGQTLELLRSYEIVRSHEFITPVYNGTLTALHARERKAITSWLWETFTVPVILGGSILSQK